MAASGSTTSSAPFRAASATRRVIVTMFASTSVVADSWIRAMRTGTVCQCEDRGMVGVDAIVVAGGRGTRLGGADKASITVGARTLLERALAAVADAERV